MLTDIAQIQSIYLACGYTDMRRGVDGLAAIVQQNFKLDPFTNSVFLFCGRRSDRIKALYWDTNGFILLYKRLEEGRFQWPRNKAEVMSLSAREFRWLMEGLSIEQPQAHRPLKNIKFA